jgi:hypothetical protein
MREDVNAQFIQTKYTIDLSAEDSFGSEESEEDSFVVRDADVIDCLSSDESSCSGESISQSEDSLDDSFEKEEVLPSPTVIKKEVPKISKGRISVSSKKQGKKQKELEKKLLQQRQEAITVLLLSELIDI